MTFRETSLLFLIAIVVAFMFLAAVTPLSPKLGTELASKTGVAADPRLIRDAPKELPKLSEDGTVKWSDIKKLEDYVDLNGDAAHITPADKKKWAEAMTSAEHLAQEMADCDQADCLRQFMVCGKEVSENTPDLEVEMTKLRAIPLIN